MEKNAIRDLIRGRALELYGQPKWTFGKNTCNTYEVFVERLRLSEGESVPAWPILDLIEQDEELTVLFSDWFLEETMRSAAALGEKTSSHVTLSINLLPHYANREGFVEQVLGVLKKTGLPADRLQFEVSEAQALSGGGVANLNRLHDEYGIGLLLANFGRGNSNVNLLREVHFDGLELDRSFAAGVPGHEQTCRVIIAMIHMAHTLDLFVCAKGIENQDQFEFFEELNCAKGQGYLIGRPMGMEALREYIDKYALKHKA